MIRNISFLIIFCFSFSVYSQCDVNNQQAPFLADPVGSYNMQLIDGVLTLEPFDSDADTLTAFPNASEGQLYEAVVGVRIPTDTSFVYDLGSGPTLFEDVVINSISINSVDGIPMGFSWECVGGSDSPNECSWSGGDYGCIRFFSDNPIPSGLSGIYPLNVLLDVSATYSGLFDIPVPIDITVDDLLDFYVLVIDEENNSNTYEILSTRTFDIISAYPNPVSNQFNLEYGNDKAEEVTFKVYDILGNLIFDELYTSNVGYNKIIFDAEKLFSGIYTMTLSNSEHLLTDRLIVK